MSVAVCIVWREYGKVSAFYADPLFATGTSPVVIINHVTEVKERQDGGSGKISFSRFVRARRNIFVMLSVLLKGCQEKVAVSNAL